MLTGLDLRYILLIIEGVDSDSITAAVFLTPVVTDFLFPYSQPPDANSCTSTAEARAERRRKGDRMDAKLGATDV